MTDDFDFGTRHVSLDGRHFYDATSTMGAFIDVLAFLGWVARGCPTYRVVKVDQESGVVTYELL